MTLHQDAALDGALVGDADLAVGEVAQPAVDQLGGPAGGAEGEVVGVDGEHGQAAGDGVEGDAGAGDAEADRRPGRRRSGSVRPRPARDPRVVGGHGGQRSGVSEQRRSSASSSSSVTSSSTIVCADSTKPWAASSSARAIAVGLPGADRARRPGRPRICSRGERRGSRPGSGRGGRAGRAAAARGRARRSAGTARCRAARGRCRRSSPTSRSTVGAVGSSAASASATTPPHSRVIRSPSSCGMSARCGRSSSGRRPARRATSVSVVRRQPTSRMQSRAASR